MGSSCLPGIPRATPYMEMFINEYILRKVSCFQLGCRFSQNPHRSVWAWDIVSCYNKKAEGNKATVW
jgi:hypothetical protein